MYKCTECGQEYTQKPEYCDCGNNIFEQEVESIQQPQNNAAAQKETDIKQDYAVREIVNTSSGRVDNKSLAIFVLCIILSILSLVFIGRTSEEKNQSGQNTEKKQSAKQIQIPSIDEIWDDTAKTVSSSNDKTISASEPPVIIQTIYKITPQAKQQASSPKINTSPAQQKPSNAKTNAKPKTNVSKPVSSAAKSQTVPKINTAQAKQELQNYKIILRNKIASKINFLSVVGDGDCVISFKLSSSGKLTNRSFSKQSDNDSLNDAVYNAVMQTPAFNPPPAAYKNETLKLSVKMYGGNFEVDLN